MSKPKLLELNCNDLVQITKEINKNILENRNRNAAQKISTDKFLRENFKINRKDFSFTLKEKTDIKYNQSTFLYDIPSYVNNKNTKVNPDIVNKSNNSVNHSIIANNNKVIKDNTYSIPKDIQKNTFQILDKGNDDIKELLSLKNELKEMLNWWKNQSKINIIDNEITNKKLTGEVVTRSYKMYKSIADEFSKFANKRKESVKDLISLAILEFLEKHGESN